MHFSANSNENPNNVDVRHTTRTPATTESCGQKRICIVCGKPSGSNICRACADKIRAEAVARKKREDKGEE
jgi:hypothetical protein